MRAPEVELPAGEARCLPRGHCAQATVCARWLAKPVPGVPVGDFTGTQHGLFLQGKCLHCLPADAHRKRTPDAPQGRVHEAPKGLC